MAIFYGVFQSINQSYTIYTYYTNYTIYTHYLHIIHAIHTHRCAQQSGHCPPGHLRVVSDRVGIAPHILHVPRPTQSVSVFAYPRLL